MNPDMIDARRAMALKNAGMTWRQVAHELTRRAGRSVPFRAESVSTAVYRELGKARAMVESPESAGKSRQDGRTSAASIRPT